MRRSVLTLGGIVVLVGAAAGVYWQLRGFETTDADGGTAALPESEATVASSSSTFATNVAIPVEGAQVVQDTLVISVSAAAQAAAQKQVVVRTQVGGPVVSVRVRESQRVSRGAILVAIDTTEYALRVADAVARVSAAEAQYREQTLFDDTIEDPEVRAERERVARARSGLDQANIALLQAKLELERTSIRAPFAGRIADLNVVPGQWVNASDQLLTVIDLNPIEVEVQVLESEVALLQAGRGASISFAAFPGETFTGQIATINPMVDRNTRTARVTVAIPNPDARILPGMYARVSLEARKFPDRILVPRSAVLERDRRTMLFVFEGEGQTGLAKWRYVTTGLSNDSLVEILPDRDTDMVEAGEWVLTDGHYTLIHDAQVRLVRSVREAGGRPQ
ncbi:MAG: efflux RND transporter periplasmic adaptor subunit [Gemmatimonadales bacterium]